MLNVTFVRIEQDDIKRLQRWLAELPERKSELEKSYLEQGTRQELFYVLQGKRGPILAMITELKDVESGIVSFLKSQHPLDIEFKELIQEISQGPATFKTLYDSVDCIEPLFP
ncbi:MAG: hypothetical protein JRC77_05010 [Deltaproteobacteria bacterium]|nr:hypothetical protein [Deltaproteobacteria bacterium]